jgi:hypothetical protein
MEEVSYGACLYLERKKVSLEASQILTPRALGSNLLARCRNRNLRHNAIVGVLCTSKNRVVKIACSSS